MEGRDVKDADLEHREHEQDHGDAEVHRRAGVRIFYVPAFHPILVPALLILSAIKFTLVVLFYMHLKMDSKIFTMIFGGPLLLATAIMIGLCFLFGVFVIR